MRNMHLYIHENQTIRISRLKRILFFHTQNMSGWSDEWCPLICYQIYPLSASLIFSLSQTATSEIKLITINDIKSIIYLVDLICKF